MKGIVMTSIRGVDRRHGMPMPMGTVLAIPVAIIDCQPETGYVSIRRLLDSGNDRAGNARFELAELCVLDADDDGLETALRI